jgi:glycosyltransferase involved in cell wall biosynthesis
VPKWLRAPLRSVVNAVELQLARCATLIVVATPHIAERFGAMSRAAVVVQNYPRLAEMSAEVERRLPHGFEVTYVGAISKARGVFNMIEAVSCVEGEIAFNLGGHFESKAIEEKVRASAAGRPIRCLGFLDREQVRDVLSRSSCGFVLFEPERNYLLCYPTKMFEYMAAGVPVIASDFPLWRSIVEECGCGLLVPPHEPREVARALATLRDDPVAAAEMGMRGRRAVIETLNWERESAKLIEAYRRILPAQA